MKVNLFIYRWRWQNISPEQARDIIENKYSILIDKMLEWQQKTSKDILFDLIDIEQKRFEKAFYNYENGKRFLTISRSLGIW